MGLMAEHSKNDNVTYVTNSSNTTTTTSSQQQQGKPMMYDFLSMKPADSSPVVLPPKTAAVSEASLSASASLGASSGGGRGPISSSSDLASERQAGNHLEGVPFYATRSDISGTEISNRLAASKRSNPESALMNHDYLENLHLMKMMRNGSGGERQRRSHDDEVFHHMRPNSGTLILHPPSVSRTDANVSRWERGIPLNAGPSVQYTPRGAQLVPYMQQMSSNKFKEANASPPIVSQSAADEGSRTGIKGPEILSTVNASGGVAEKNSFASLPSGSRLKSGTFVAEPESSAPSSRQGLTSASRQMTIFYGGQAHVFDDVHPNKADVIMALAGSNGGSWSTTYAAKSSLKLGSESYMPSGDLEGRSSGNLTLPQDFRGRLPVTGITNHTTGSNDRTPTPAGYQRSMIPVKDARNAVQGGERETVAEDRRER